MRSIYGAVILVLVFAAAPKPAGGRGGYVFHIACGGGAGAAWDGTPPGPVPLPDVTVWPSGGVGSYDTAVISSTDAQALYDWLTANGYTVPDAARPIIQAYVAEGQKFIAFRYSPLT